MKAWKKYALLSIAVLIFAGNLAAILQGEREISRLQIINQLVAPQQIDIIESIEIPGVITSISEEHIYINEKLGSLGSIDIEVGQEVQQGETLFSYNNSELESAQQEIEFKIEQNDLRSTQLTAEMNTLINNQNRIATTVMESENEMIVALENEIAQYDVQIMQREHQIAALELEKEMYQNSLLSLTEQQAELDITSPVTGVVKEINTNRNQPFITLVTSPLVAKGEVTEEESLELTEGLKVEVIVHDQDPIEGSLSHISSFPAQEPAIDLDTTYPFHVDILDSDVELKIGYHILLKMIQNEIPDAIVIPTHVILSQAKEPFVLVATAGQIEKRDIALGTITNDQQEITKGLNTTDLVVEDPSAVSYNQPFVTTLKLAELEYSALSSFRKKEWLMLMLQGL